MTRLTFLFAPLTLAIFLTAAPAAAGELPVEPVRDALVAAARANLPDTVRSVAVRGVHIRGNVEVSSNAAVEVVIHPEGDEDWIGRVSVDAEIFVSGRSIVG